MSRQVIDEVVFFVRRQGQDEEHHVWITEPRAVDGRWECEFGMTEFGNPKVARGVSRSAALYSARYIVTGAYSALDKHRVDGAPLEWPWQLPLS